MKFIALISIFCAVATQSGCVSHRVAKYAIHRAAKARKEAHEARREAEAQEASRAESQSLPMTPRDDARSDFR